MTNLLEIKELFEKGGGKFITPLEEIRQKLKDIKAYVFDWDGVFNNGSKGESKSSNYSEVDSMGTNMLRLGYWMENNEELPIVSIITGETNKIAVHIAERENFNHVYHSFKNKTVALEHLLNTFQLEAKQVAFFFDDILDFSVANVCGLRFMISHTTYSLLNKYAVDNNLVDYISGQQGGNFAVREVCELILGLSNNYEKVISERVKFTNKYKDYLNKRNKVNLRRFVFDNSNVRDLNC